MVIPVTGNSVHYFPFTVLFYQHPGITILSNHYNTGAVPIYAKGPVLKSYLIKAKQNTAGFDARCLKYCKSWLTGQHSQQSDHLIGRPQACVFAATMLLHTI